MASKNGSTKKVTLGKAWRKAREEGEAVALPSGNVARIRPVALDVLLTSGNLPDLLSPIAAKTLWTEVDTDQIADMAETAIGMAELVNIVCQASFVEPRIVDEATADDEITLEDIDFLDKTSVFQLATQPAEVLRRFRQQQEGNVDPVLDGQNDSDAAE